MQRKEIQTIIDATRTFLLSKKMKSEEKQKEYIDFVDFIMREFEISAELYMNVAKRKQGERR